MDMYVVLVTGDYLPTPAPCRRVGANGPRGKTVPRLAWASMGHRGSRGICRMRVSFPGRLFCLSSASFWRGQGRGRGRAKVYGRIFSRWRRGRGCCGWFQVAVGRHAKGKANLIPWTQPGLCLSVVQRRYQTLGKSSQYPE
jgi:hypothetical protein